MINAGDFSEGAIVYIPINTASISTGESVTITNFLNTDVHIHKNDSLTQRNNAAGITVSIDFDGITGNHLIKIDTSDDTVAGFWVANADYFIRIEGTTIEAKSVNVWVGMFSIENRAASKDLANATDGLGALKTLIDTIDTVVDAIKAKTDNLPADPADDSDIDAQLATIAGYLDTEIATILAAVDTEIAAIKAKTDNLPADPADDSDIDAQLATIAGYLDTEIAAILAAVDTEVAAVKAKTDNLPADPASETNVDANETKIDTIDTVVDAIKVVTDILNGLIEDVSGNRFTEKSLEQAPSGTGASAAAIADAVLDEALSEHVDAGSLGKKVGDQANPPSQILNDYKATGFSTHDAAAVKTAIEAAGSHLALIKAQTDNLPADPADDSDIDAQLATIAGYLDTEIAAILAAVDTEIAAIKAKTDNLPSDPASETNVDANETKIDTIDTVVDGIKAITDNLPDAGALSSLATAAALTTVDTVVDAVKAKTDNLPADPADDSDIDAQLATIAGYLDTEIATILAAVDTEIAAIKAKTDNLPSGIAKNVALSNFEFLMIDSTDHVSVKTGLTITAQISKDGGAFTSCTNSVAEIGSGLYKVNITQAEMNADIITLKFTSTGADQRTITITTS